MTIEYDGTEPDVSPSSETVSTTRNYPWNNPTPSAPPNDEIASDEENIKSSLALATKLASEDMIYAIQSGTDDDDDVPEQFCCSITQEIMVKPVVAKDGYTYDEKNIAKWSNLNNTSPVTRETLNRGEWYENRRLKEEIEAWLSANSDHSSVRKFKATLEAVKLEEIRVAQNSPPSANSGSGNERANPTIPGRTAPTMTITRIQTPPRRERNLEVMTQEDRRKKQRMIMVLVIILYLALWFFA